MSSRQEGKFRQCAAIVLNTPALARHPLAVRRSGGRWQNRSACGGAMCEGTNLRRASTCQNGACMPGDLRVCGYKGCDRNACHESCPDGAVDSGSACVDCGGNKQPCCARNRCLNSNFACVPADQTSQFPMQCQRCGGDGEVCCKGRNPLCNAGYECSTPDGGGLCELI